MTIYGVDLTTLPLIEREKWYYSFRDNQFFTTDVFGKSGVMAVIVYWSNGSPINNFIHPNCEITEIQPGYEDLYRAKFESL